MQALLGTTPSNRRVPTTIANRNGSHCLEYSAVIRQRTCVFPDDAPKPAQVWHLL